MSPHASRPSSSFLCLLLYLIVASVSCDADDERGTASAAADHEASRPTDSAPTAPSEAELIDQLSAIGYLAGSEPAGDSHGVIQHDASRVAPGLNLITSGHGPVALLMDMQGRVLHEWRAEFLEVFPDHPRFAPAMKHRWNFWRDALLFPNGDIIVIWELFGLFKLDRDSRVLWAVPEPVHHELLLTQAGEIVHLQAKRKKIPGIEGDHAVEDFIVTRDAEGRELRRLAMSEALRNANWLGLREAFWQRAEERGYGLTAKGRGDPFHTNSLWLLSAAEATRLGGGVQAGDALVSMAMLDTIAILDMEKGVTRWWQQGPFGMQHQPRPTPSGDIILFNNFRSADRSSLLTLDPRTGRVTREYTGPAEEPLYSKRSGRVQMLSNGNTLVVETDGGRALELAGEGEALVEGASGVEVEMKIVWEFRNPYRAGKDDSKVASLFSLKRVSAKQTGWLGRENP